MRFIWILILLTVLVFAPQFQANATTFTMPLIGEVEIVGDLPAPVPISISMTPTSLGASYWVLDTSIVQAGNIDGAFSEPQGCVGTTCGTLAGFFVCGGTIHCGISLMPGTVISRTGEAVSFDIADTSRFLTIDTSVRVDGPLNLELTVDLPDGLQLLVISDPIPEGLAQTPLPGGLPLFASGLGALGLLGWRRKRKVAH
jgi:hypothetical protein